MQVNSYPLNMLTVPQKVMLPLGAKAMSVKAINGQLTLYALVGPSARDEERTFCLVVTGQALPPGAIKTYLGTCAMPQAGFYDLAVHAFEL